MMVEKIGEVGIDPRNVKYPCTNESVPAVLAGIDPHREDVVVSICGSGDVPIALSPYVKKVYAVDNSRCQINYAREQATLLAAQDDLFFRDSLVGNLNPFCLGGVHDIGTSDLINRKDYFSSRMNDFGDALHKIEFVEADILDFLGDFNGGLHKIYFSNAMAFGGEGILESFSLPGLNPGGLIYLSGSITYYDRKYPHFVKDSRLTRRAQEVQWGKGCPRWHPKVFKKKAA
ncbi:hypothetical protein HN935_00780 [archaeon]|nr:hypothetical protein [archaeon]